MRSAPRLMMIDSNICQASFKAQVLDTEARLNKLFDHLNNETLLLPDTVMSMQELAFALRDRDFETAQSIQMELHTNKTDQCGQWMVSSCGQPKGLMGFH